jgi:UV DNA damage endonuclease
MNKDINFGYACLNTQLRKEGVFCSRTTRLATLDTKESPVAYLKGLAHENLKDLRTILEWNAKNGIRLFRMSSDMFPFSTHNKYRYDLQDFRNTLKQLGDFAKTTNQRLTMHPGQFHQLTSLKEDVINNTIESLTFHADILDVMGLDKNSILVIHGGSKQGGVDAALARFKTSWFKLPRHVQERIVLENDEMCFAVEDLLGLCDELGIPLVLDYHHHDIYPGSIPLVDTLPSILKTWHDRDIRPKFHMSQSRVGITEKESLTARRAHSDIIDRLPAEDVLPDSIDLMLECKLKEQSVPSVQKVLYMRQ